jgi:hypothetical protein
MRSKSFLFPLFLLTALVISLPAQEEEGPPINTDWSGVGTGYSRGDMIFTINLGLIFPLFFVEQDRGTMANNISTGGAGMLGWNYFLGPHLFIGAELNGFFAGTVAENNYFGVPIGVKAGYQFVLRRFEFPFSLSAGMIPQGLLQSNYLGFYAKPSAGVFFRFNSEWSFGLSADFFWVPQWTDVVAADGNNVNIHGFFLDVLLGARYHF